MKKIHFVKKYNMDKNECRNLEIKEEYSENIECLGALMNLQKTLQEDVFGHNFEKMRERLGDVCSFIDWNESALQDEIREMYEALGGVDTHGSAIWKPWKSKHKEAQEKRFDDLSDSEKKELRMELIDGLHFWFNMMLVCGMDAKMVYEYYVAKNLENIRRQETNY